MWRQLDADGNGVQDYWTHDVEGFRNMFCAYPSDESMETCVFIVNEDGVVYTREGTRAPVLQWPAADPAATGWVPGA